MCAGWSSAAPCLDYCHRWSYQVALGTPIGLVAARLPFPFPSQPENAPERHTAQQLHRPQKPKKKKFLPTRCQVAFHTPT